MLAFRLLGPFAVERDGVALDLGAPRQRALLALLALHAGETLSVDRLVDELWGETAPKTAPHVIQVYVSHLRRVLAGAPGEPVIETRGPGYALVAPPEAFDLARFEQLLAAGRAALTADRAEDAAAAVATALGLWRGGLLDDLPNEGFVLAEARRVAELRLAAVELQLEVAVARGPTPADVAELRSLAAEHPFRERVHELLIRALAGSGRQAEALDAYGAVRQALDAELGIEPGPALRAAQAAVLRQQVAPVAPPRGAVVAVALQPSRLAAVGRAADGLATATERDVVLACILARDDGAAPDLAGAAREAATVRGGLTSVARSAAFAARDRGAAVAGFAAEHDAELLVLDVAGLGGPDGRLPGPLVEALEGITADVVLVPGEAASGAGAIAVPFGGTPHDWLAAEIGALLARAGGGGLRLIGATADDDDASRLVARAALALQRALGVDAEPVLAAPGDGGVLAAAAGAEVVLGVSERWRAEGLGRVRAAIAEAAPALVVRAGIRPGLLAPPAAATRFAWSVARGR